MNLSISQYIKKYQVRRVFISNISFLEQDQQLFLFGHLDFLMPLLIFWS